MPRARCCSPHGSGERAGGEGGTQQARRKVQRWPCSSQRGRIGALIPGKSHGRCWQRLHIAGFGLSGVFGHSSGTSRLVRPEQGACA